MGGNGGAVDVVGDSAEEPMNRLRGSWEEHGRCLRADELHAGLMRGFAGEGRKEPRTAGGAAAFGRGKYSRQQTSAPLPSLFLPLQSPPCYSAHSPWP